jgi:hypothetical protein
MRALASPRHTVPLLELMARLNRETGSHATRALARSRSLSTPRCPWTV